MREQEPFDLQQLYVFHVAAGSRTFTEAAERLHISQSAVSHAIRKLEKSAGSRLFARNRPPVRLTGPGRLLAESCSRIFTDLRRCREAMLRSDAKTLVGRLKVGATVEFGNSILARGVAPFLEKHPLIEMGFTFSHDLLRPLLADELDLIIDCQVHAREELARKPLFREQYMLVAAPALVDRLHIRRLQDLSRAVWLTLDSGGDWWQRFLAQLPSAIELSPDRMLPVNHLRGLINMASSGVGVALVPAYCVQNELQNGSLKRMFPNVRIREDKFFLYCLKDRLTDPNIVAFTKFARRLHLAPR